MSNPTVTEPRSTTASPRPLQAMPDVDDDDDAADCDDDDDDGVVASRQEKWFSSSGFGSPEWWSR